MKMFKINRLMWAGCVIKGENKKNCKNNNACK
jgi:hypothetical protein